MREYREYAVHRAMELAIIAVATAAIFAVLWGIFCVVVRKSI